MQIHLLDTQINEDIAELQKERIELMSPQAIDYAKDKVQTSPEDAMSKRLAQIADKNEKINAKIDRYAGMKELMIRQIRELPMAGMQTCLFHRFVLDESIDKIAEAMHLSKKYCSILCGNALRQFEIQFAGDMKNYMIL